MFLIILTSGNWGDQIDAFRLNIYFPTTDHVTL